MPSPGVLLREARLRHGVTQQELAVRAGTRQSAISRIEHDHVSPSFATLQMFLRLLGEDLQLVARPLNHGHDLQLLRENLALTPQERIDRGVAFSNFVRRNRGAARER